jgi:hypothetical protein
MKNLENFTKSSFSNNPHKFEVFKLRVFLPVDFLDQLSLDSTSDSLLNFSSVHFVLRILIIIVKAHTVISVVNIFNRWQSPCLLLLVVINSIIEFRLRILIDLLLSLLTLQICGYISHLWRWHL